VTLLDAGFGVSMATAYRYRNEAVRRTCRLVQSTVQWGGRTPKAGGRDLDGREHSAMPTQAVATSTR
jgi:protein gp37